MRQDILHEYRVKSQRQTENPFMSKQGARTRSKITLRGLIGASIGGASQESARNQFTGQPQQARFWCASLRAGGGFKTRSAGLYLRGASGAIQVSNKSNRALVGAPLLARAHTDA